MVVLAFVPSQVSRPELFTAIWIVVSSLITGIVTFMSTSRHLNSLAFLMQSINNPIDMDNVVERLQRGRFSRFEEPWKVQVLIIKMFCRLIKFHYGVDPRSGSLIVGRKVRQAHDAFDGEYFYGEIPPATEGPVSGDEGSIANANRRGAAALSADGEDARTPQSPLRSSAANNTPNSPTQGFNTKLDGDEFSLYSVRDSPVGDDAPPLPPTRSGSPPNGPSDPPAADRQQPRSSSGSLNDSALTSPPDQPPSGAPGPVVTVAPRRSGSVRRRAPMSGDPLSDNAKSWDDVLVASDAGGEGQSRSLLLQLLGQVSVGQDLSKVALPVSILEPRSLLEKLSDLFIHPSLLGDIADARDDIDFVQRVARWYVSGFHMRPRGAKKPYNPILGETFEAVFNRGKRDELWYLAEQVSHHPPVSVFIARHTRTGVQVTASFQPKSKLINPNCGASIGDGVMVLHCKRRCFHLSWPSAYVSGVLTGPMRLEVVGDVTITPFPRESSSISALLKFERKGYFTGCFDHLTGTIMRGKEKLYSIEGLWHSTMTIQRIWPNSSQTAAEPKKLFLDPKAEVAVRPFAVDTTHPKPSRVVWKLVTLALRNSDAQAAKAAKDEVEAAQRVALRASEARGAEYLPALFRMTETAATSSMSLREWTYIGKPFPVDGLPREDRTSRSLERQE